MQGFGSALVKEIQGDYHTVVGLPIPLLLELLLEGGLKYEFGSLVPLSRE
ncbi:MAG: Maf family protein [Longimicrobiales bacterium]